MMETMSRFDRTSGALERGLEIARLGADGVLLGERLTTQCLSDLLPEEERFDRGED